MCLIQQKITHAGDNIVEIKKSFTGCSILWRACYVV